MTISYVGAGASASGTTSITPTYPAGATTGQLAVLQVMSGGSGNPVPSTPSGWTLSGTIAGGGGTFGSGVGPRRLTWYMRELAGIDAAPTTAIPSSTGAVIGGQIFVLSRTAGTGWRWATAFGENTTSSTAFSAPGQSGLTFVAGDFVALGYSLGLSTSSIGSESATASGVTFGTFTHQINVSITTGNGGRLGMAWATVTTGAGTPTPTVTATLSAATTGVAGVLRIREASSGVTATAQSVFPPRNLVSATGLTGDDIVTATLYRQAGTNLTPVRAASSIDVTGQSSLLRVDAEQPFGVSLNYAAVLTDINGNQWTVYSSPITSTVSSDVVSDAIRGIGAAVKIESPLGWKRDRDATQFNINGRIVVVGKPRSARSGTITVRTETDGDGDALNSVLDNATEGVILVRRQNSLARLDGTYALIDDSEDPNWYDEFRWFQLNVVQADDWPDVMEAAGFTLADIAANFSTLADIAAFFTTNLLAIALYDFGP
ncbi:hypothetical protein ACWD5V_09540 [Streptomyces sp. NPDC002523]